MGEKRFFVQIAAFTRPAGPDLVAPKAHFRAEGAFSMRWLHGFGIMGRVLFNDLSGPLPGTFAKSAFR